MPVTFLVKHFTEQAEQVNVTRLLLERLKGFRRERTHKTVHVSDLTRETQFCAREFALMDTHGREPKDRYLSAAQRVAFDQGDSLHDMCREQWLAKDVVGHWQCVYCGNTVEFSKKPPRCPKCRCSHLLYREVEFNALGTSGSIDILIDFNVGKHALTEAKTMDKDEFKSLIAPIAEHRVRVACYLYLIAHSDSPYKNRIDLKQGHVLYISKAYGIKNQDHNAILPFKSYVVKRDDKLAAEYFGPAIALQDFRGGGPMPQPICANPFSKRAQSCPMSKECFSHAG